MTKDGLHTKSWTNNKENKSINHSAVDDFEMPASHEQELELQSSPKKSQTVKIVKLIMKKLSMNLDSFMNDHKGSVKNPNEARNAFNTYLMGLSLNELKPYMTQFNIEAEDCNEMSSDSSHQSLKSESDNESEDLHFDIQSSHSDNEIKQEEIIQMTTLSSSINSLVASEFQNYKGKDNLCSIFVNVVLILSENF